MPNNTDRATRREEYLLRRRTAQAVDLLSTQEEVADLKEKRPPETSVRRVLNMPTDDVGAVDEIDITARGVQPFQWGVSKWGQASWGETHVE